ncbi:proteasome subunit beta type-2-A [Dorcoceras hygrometricum]|nr:proteasome subunit beta type-2-A [Dorcoceras hygrometricum]
MESVFGLVGKGFAIVAADTSAVHSILGHKTNEDKIMLLDSHELIGASGETGDRAATANFTRGELATALRKLDKAAFGYGAYFALSTMDRHYRRDMTVEEAIDLVDKCILETRTRLVVAPPNFVIKIIDKDGAREYAWRSSIKDTSVASG